MRGSRLYSERALRYCVTVALPRFGKWGGGCTFLELQPSPWNYFQVVLTLSFVSWLCLGSYSIYVCITVQEYPPDYCTGCTCTVHQFKRNC